MQVDHKDYLPSHPCPVPLAPAIPTGSYSQKGVTERGGIMGRIVGYARTSTADQLLDLQLDALRQIGADPIHTDQLSGARRDRPGLAAALAACQPGDTLAVWRLDRLGRGVAHLAATVEELHRRNVAFRSITEGMDTATVSGRLLLHVLAAVAQAEREIAQERISAGMNAAKARGRHVGRRPMLDRMQAQEARQMLDTGRGVREVAKLFRTSPATLYRTLARHPIFRT